MSSYPFPLNPSLHFVPAPGPDFAHWSSPSLSLLPLFFFAPPPGTWATSLTFPPSLRLRTSPPLSPEIIIG
ncbi:hypothetical protein CBS147355_5291 [Penicillium roqueforti]|nr:hypothetical protein CBS147355_5291 [Penicillium roqueforti]